MAVIPAPKRYLNGEAQMATEPKTAFTAKEREIIHAALNQYEASLRRGVNTPRNLASVKHALQSELNELPAVRVKLNT